MPHCMVPGCTNYSQRSDGSISFHRIPSNQQMKKKWLARIPRANPCPTAYSYVCSDILPATVSNYHSCHSSLGKKNVGGYVPDQFRLCFPNVPAVQLQNPVWPVVCKAKTVKLDEKGSK